MSGNYQESYFVVVDDKTAMVSKVAYPQVKILKGHNLSTGARIAIGVSIAVALVILTAYVITLICEE